MAAIVQTPVVATNSVTSYGTAYATNPTAGNLLVACVEFRGYGVISGVSVTGSNNGAFTKAIGATSDECSIWYKLNCAGGAETVTLAFSSGGNTTSYIQLLEVSGIATSAALDQTLLGSGSAPASPFLYPCSTGITTTAAGIIISAISFAANITKSVPTGYTGTGWTPADPTRMASSYKISSGSESTTAEYDGDSGADYHAVLANFLDAAGGDIITTNGLQSLDRQFGPQRSARLGGVLQ